MNTDFGIIKVYLHGVFTFFMEFHDAPGSEHHLKIVVFHVKAESFLFVNEGNMDFIVFIDIVGVKFNPRRFS